MSVAEVVRRFIEEVRAGKQPEAAALYMAESVLAHQITAENSEAVSRTPANYTEHIREFLDAYGPFTLVIDEFLVQNDKVYVRWTQTGKHLGQLDGYAPTQQPLVTIGSAVYRVAEGKIVEYWIQQDRMGLVKQLQKNARGHA